MHGYREGQHTCTFARPIADIYDVEVFDGVCQQPLKRSSTWSRAGRSECGFVA